MPRRFASLRLVTTLTMALAMAGVLVPHVVFSAAASSPALTFEKDIRAIFKTNCFQCHGEDGVHKAGLDVRLKRFLEKGGESGAALIPGKPQESLLVKVLRDGKMPKGKPHLKDEQIALIERWIAAGAPTARPEPETITAEHVFTEEEKNWWAFQPIKKTPAPSLSSTVIDSFIGVKLAEAKLAFSAEADRRTLIRRASFDLLGLPPSPEEVDAFEKDTSPLAYERLIDRLLSSPHYGEQWGRHWLDVAGYADSDGYSDADTVRTESWRYRDYVIKSLNEDKAFDQFVREQLAGDEMLPQPFGKLKPDEAEKLIATGFLRMAPDGTMLAKADEQTTARNANIADTLKIVSSSLYGLTVGCAQCHDHRYDPITQADYYRLRAIFEPALDWKNWRTPPARRFSLMTKAERDEAARIEAEAKAMDAERIKKTAAWVAEALEKEITRLVPEAERNATRAAYEAAVAKRTPAQLALLKKYPAISTLSAASLYLYDSTYGTKHKAEIDQMTAAAAEVRARKPVEEFIQPLTEIAGVKPPATFVFHRGDPESPKEEVKPGDLSVLASVRNVDVPEKNPALKTSGRRLAFAQSITDGKHPLLARVMVNRVWMHHFGKGIVGSADDFGTLGQEPTHPELLDWLSSDFMEQGWSLKLLHKQIMLSAAYRQSSARNAERERIDPDNRLLSRMNIRRLEAETLRDALIKVSGKLTPTLYGKPVPIALTEEGDTVVGIDTRDGSNRLTGKFTPLNGEEFRRSLYVQVRRSKPLGMLVTFDAPAMEPNCGARLSSTVSPQSLLLMNSTTMRMFAQHFGERVLREAGNDPKAQVARAWRLAFNRSAKESELFEAVEFMLSQTEYYKTHPVPLETVLAPTPKTNADPALMGLAALCHALMSTNEFLYLD